MNKIYKVIWSKVKHQYVVVSELAHSNGKQSRTSRNSIRSRIAALVVCGAIAAFGVFNALPNSAYAADSDYIAFVTTEKGQNANENQGYTIQINGYKYTSTRIAKPDNSYTWYWVRDGYNIQLERLERPGSDGSKDYVVRAFKDGGGEVETSLVHSYQNKIEDTGVTTLNGKNLHSYEAGVYAGGSNGYTAVRMEDKWSEADQTFKPNNDPMIFDGKEWRQAERTDFKDVKFNEETGNYEYNGQIVATENLYVVDFVKTKGNDTEVEGTKLGCFVVDGKVYTGTVHGKNNEILMTGINEDNKYVTYWASEYTDEKATMAQMPISQYKETISGLASDINAIHQDDIKEIQINQIDNGGSINLQTNGEFVPARDEKGDIITDETGKPVYVAQGGKNIPGGITIRNTTNSGSEGNDVAVEISNDKNSFTVDAGSKVVGKITTKNGVEEAGVGDANKTLTGLKINGVDYALSQGKTYSNGNGISIDEENNKISVNAGDGLTFGTEQTNDEGKLKVNVGDGLSIKDGQVINNLKVTADTNATKNNKNGGNWTVTDSKANITLTNTTLDEADSNSYNSDENNLIKDDSNANNNTKYGRNYKVFDTDGNEVALNDVASADTLKTIDTTKIGDLKYNDFTEGDSDTTSIVKNDDNLTTAVGKLDNAVNETKTLAGKHTKMTVNDGTLATTDGEYNSDGNLQLKQTVENDQTTYDVKLNDNITLGNGQSAITLNGSPENSNDPALSVGTDKFVVDQDGSLSVSDKFNVDAETGNIYAANNSGSAIMMNDDSVALNAGGNGVVASDEGILLNTNGFDEDIKLVTKGTTVSVDKDGTTFTNVNTNETTNIDGGTINVGDRLMVEDDGSIYATNNNGSTVMINDNGVALNSEGNGVVVSGEGITLNTNGSAVTVDRFNGTTFTNTNTGETTNINGGTITTNTVKGLDNTTWSEDLAEEVANNEELQGTAATQGQLQQAVNEVAEVANAGWNAKAGGNTINVKPNETLNFEGDGNITVSATDGTSNELKFGLNDNITLGDKTSTSITLYTDPTSETTVVGTDGNTTNVTGYVPESYKSGTGADFVKNNGGFALFTTDTQGHGIFGVTTKGTAHGKDFVTYTKDIYNNSVQYSLNDVGNIVTQISHAVFDEGFGNTGMEYTLISDFEDEADKDSPFDAKEGKTRTIGLAVRQDGAVIVGAVVNDEGISSDRGIRINAETKTTYDENDNEVTNNIATITGLENTEWKPKAPEQTPQAKMATFAANDGTTTTETSRAATEAQLDDLYSSVVGYNVKDGSIDHTHVTLGGKKTYGLGRAIGDHSGGVVLNNVAYASGTDGSEAVNVDYLNDAINNAVKDGGAISDSDRHLQEGTYHVNDQGKVELIVADEKGENQSTVTIDNIANKNDITNLDNKIDNTFNDLNDKINNIDNVETDVKGGNINEDGTISLKTENEDGTTTNVTLKGQLTDSGVVQEGTSFDKETGTITITSQDKYSGETSSVKVEGIASTEVVGATNKEDLATAYKDADKDGNATTEYITDSESMVEADVALDHAIQDVAGTSYANDMVLSNRIDSVEKRLGNVEERIDKVGAMAAAIANLRTMGFDPEAPTEIAIGVGQYKSETGIAIGVFHYPNQDFMLSASLSSSGDELMGGIGATWKLGRKSAAERAKDEEARHLEQAEEMKKLAQQEKVKAQAQRHAKLLAERQQASQKNA